MSNTEKLNDILEDKFDNWEHPVDETNWKDMRKMIDDSRRNKRRWAVAAILFLGLMVAGGIYTYSSLNDNNNKNEVVSTTLTHSSVNSSEMNSNTTISTSSVNNPTNSPNQSAATTQSTLPLNPSASGALNSSARKVSHSNKTTGGYQLKTVVASPKLTVYNGIISDGEQAVQKIAPINLNSVNVTSNTESGIKEVKTLNTIETNKGLSDKLTAGNVGKKNFFSIDFGLDLSLGWFYNGDTSQGHGMNPVIGIGYTRKFSPKWAIKTGLQFSGFTDMNSTSYTVSHASNDPAYSAVDTTYTTNWLYYATIPLQVEYTVGREDAIGAGGSFSYLIAQYGNMDAYKLSLTQGTDITHQGKQFMDLKGYNKYNTSVYAFYKRHLLKKFSVYAGVYWGLSDIKNDGFFRVNKFERDYGLKSIFSYSIF